MQRFVGLIDLGYETNNFRGEGRPSIISKEQELIFFFHCDKYLVLWDLTCICYSIFVPQLVKIVNL